MTTSLASKPTRTSNGIPTRKFGSWGWVIIISILPIYRLIAETVGGDVEVIILAALAVCVALGRTSRPPAASVWVICGALIPLASVFSGTSSNITKSLLVGIQLGLVVGLTPFVLRYYAIQNRCFVTKALIGFLSIQTISSIAGLVQLSGVSVFGLEANSGRANGLAAHPNVLGLMASLAILAGFYYFHQFVGGKRVAILATIIINFAALIGSGSLSSMIALATGGIIMILAGRATAKTAVSVIAGAITIAFGAITLGFEPSDLLTPVESRVNTVLGVSNDGVASLSIRQETYAFALESIRDDPIIGVGMDSINQGTFNGTTVVHNYLLRAWFQGGALLSLAFSTITVALCGMIIRAIRLGRDPLPASIIGAILAFGMTSAFYNQQQYWIPLLLGVSILGMTGAVNRPNSTSSSQIITAERQIK